MSRKYDDFKLLEFIAELKMSSFTVSEVTKQLIEKLPKKFVCPKNTRQFVHRRLKRFLSERKVKTVSLSNGKAFVYAAVSHSEETDSSKDKKNSSHTAVKAKLLEKIKECKTEMLTCIGEAEAYSEWATEIPGLTDDVKSNYQHSRDQAKLMLGKVKGFERLLAMYEARL